MALKSINPTHTKTWELLQAHYSQIKDKHLRAFFEEEKNRVNDLTFQWQDFYVDFSKNRIDNKALKLLVDLANELDLKDAIDKYFSGDIINKTEGRAVLHTALRAKKDAEVFVEGANVIPEVFEVKEKIKSFSESIISGERKTI